jgi:transposase
MKLHANAALTLKQRRQVKQLHAQGQSVRVLAERFGIHQTTIRRWAGRDTHDDRSSRPQRPRRVVTESYRQAVIAYRQAHP